MVQQTLGKLKRFVREYTGGLAPRDMQDQLGRDASRAWEVLSRDHAPEEEPHGFFRRAWYRTRVLFLGLSSKLSPPRRILFCICLLLALGGFYQGQIDSSDIGAVPAVPLLGLGIGGLVFLLALELADRVIVRDELEVARELQRELLPRQAPRIEGLDFAFSYRTANTIGGDYYDFLPLDDGRLALVMGDASGHGIAAGLVMAIANATLKLALDLDPAPEAVATLVNRALYRTGDRRAFMTLFYGVLDPSDGRLDFVCAGHPYPLLRRPTGAVEELGAGSLPLGLRLELPLHQDSTTVDPGDVLLMYTDGIPEAIDGSGRSFGFERLDELLAPGGSAQAVHDRVVDDLRRFEAGAPAMDDRSLVVLGRVESRESTVESS